MAQSLAGACEDPTGSQKSCLVCTIIHGVALICSCFGLQFRLTVIVCQPLV